MLKEGGGQCRKLEGPIDGGLRLRPPRQTPRVTFHGSACMHGVIRTCCHIAAVVDGSDKLGIGCAVVSLARSAPLFSRTTALLPPICKHQGAPVVVGCSVQSNRTWVLAQPSRSL